MHPHSARQGLATGSTATGVYARLEPTGADLPTGRHRLRWTNAGHLSPVLVSPDGTVQVLATGPELLLGIRADTTRTDHTATLPPGSTLLLYTDWPARPVPDLLDAVMDTAEGGFRDDTTVLAVRPDLRAPRR